MTWIPVQQALDWDNSTASISDGCPVMGQSGAVIQRDWLSLGRGDSTGQWWGVEGEEKWLWKEKSSGKLAVCRDVGFFSLVLDGSPMKTVVLEEKSSNSCSLCISAGLTSSRMLSCWGGKLLCAPSLTSHPLFFNLKPFLTTAESFWSKAGEV